MEAAAPHDDARTSAGNAATDHTDTAGGPSLEEHSEAMSGSTHGEPGAAAGEPKDLSAPQQAPAPATQTIKLSRTQLPEVLPLMPPWIKWPEYSKVENINTMIVRLWPYLSRATETLVHEQFAAWADEFVAKKGRGVLVGLSLDVLSMGQHPMRLEAVKVNHTEEDELIFEGPLAWASSMRVRASAHVKLLWWTFKLPLEVRDLQLKVHARILARPIRDTPPFISSITISLLERPHVHFDMPVKLPTTWFDALQLGHVLSAGSSVEAWAHSHGRGKHPPPGKPAPEAATEGHKPVRTPGPAGAAAGAAETAKPSATAEAAEPSTADKQTTSEAPAARASAPAATVGPTEGSVPFSAAGEAEAAAPAAPDLNTTELDLMALPLLNEGFRLAARVAAEKLLMYPKGYTLELVPGGARGQWAEGMLDVKLIKITGLKALDVLGTSEPYCVLQVREGRVNCANGKRKGRDLEFDEEFIMLVDSTEQQSLRLTVKDTEWGRQDIFLGAADLPLKQASFIYLPGQRVSLTMDLHKVHPSKPWSILTAPFNLLLRTLTGVMTAGGGDIEGHPDETRPPTTPSHADGAEQPPPAQDERSDRGSRQGLTPQRSQSLPNLSALMAQSDNGQGKEDDTRDARQEQFLQHEKESMAGAGQGGQQQEQEQRQQQQAGHAAEAGQGQQQQQQQQQQHKALAGMKEGAGRAVHAGHEDEAEAEAVAAYLKQRHEEIDSTNQAQQDQQQTQEQKEAEHKQMQQAPTPDSELGAHAQHDAHVVGTAFLEVVWTPFEQELPAECVGRPGFGSALGPPLPYQCTGQGNVEATHKGILTVTVLRAINVVGWEGEPDTYVKLVLFDKVQRKQDKQRSSTVYNEPHPRWGEKFDFAIICAGSVLRVAVMDKVTSAQKPVPLHAKAEDKELGHVRVPVQRVAAAGHIKHEWPLLGAEQGAIELVLEWYPEFLSTRHGQSASGQT